MTPHVVLEGEVCEMEVQAIFGCGRVGGWIRLWGMSSEVVLSELVVPAVPVDAPAVLPLSCRDVGWEELYSRAYRRVFRVGNVRRSRFPVLLPSHRAALIADWVMWKSVPKAQRPEDWPQNDEEFARRAGVRKSALGHFIGAHRIHRWLQDPGWVGEDRIRQVDDALFTATVEALEAKTKEAPALAKTFYLRTGAIKQGATTNVQIGNRVEIHGDMDQSKWLARMKALLPYLEEREAVVVPNKELSDGSSEKDSSRGVDGAGEAGDGPEVRSEPGEPA